MTAAAEAGLIGDIDMAVADQLPRERHHVSLRESEAMDQDDVRGPRARPADATLPSRSRGRATPPAISLP